MFYCVGDVNFAAIDSGCNESLVEQMPGGPDERFARAILLISRNFAHKHHFGVRIAFAKDGLRSAPP